jgi:hypothetical protein
MDVGDDVPFDPTRSVSSLVGVQEGLRTHQQQAENSQKSAHGALVEERNILGPSRNSSQ